MCVCVCLREDSSYLCSIYSSLLPSLLQILTLVPFSSPPQNFGGREPLGQLESLCGLVYLVGAQVEKAEDEVPVYSTTQAQDPHHLSLLLIVPCLPKSHVASPGAAGGGQTSSQETWVCPGSKSGVQDPRVSFFFRGLGFYYLCTRMQTLLWFKRRQN